MPLYDFTCPDCGPFRAWVPMDRSDQDTPCPHCTGNAGREVSAPHIGAMAAPLRQAVGRAERTAAAPRVMKRQHLAGCGCKLCKPKSASVSRRWMIGH